MSQREAIRHHQDAWSWKLLEHVGRQKAVTWEKLAAEAHRRGWVENSIAGKAQLRAVIRTHQDRGRLDRDGDTIRFVTFSRSIEPRVELVPAWTTGAKARRNEATLKTCQAISGALLQFVINVRKAYSAADLSDGFAAVSFPENQGFGN